MTLLLALDPGGTTGWSIWQYDALTPAMPFEHGQITGGVQGFVEWWREHERDIEPDVDEVVSESFVLDGRTVSPDVTPLRIEGALSVLWPHGVIYQRNTFKAHAPDATLKRLGFWWRGEQHARDSARHALAFLKVRKHLPTVRAYWGRDPQ